MGDGLVSVTPTCPGDSFTQSWPAIKCRSQSLTPQHSQGRREAQIWRTQTAKPMVRYRDQKVETKEHRGLVAGWLYREDYRRQYKSDGGRELKATEYQALMLTKPHLNSKGCAISGRILKGGLSKLEILLPKVLCNSPLYFMASTTLPDLKNNSGFRDGSQKSLNNNNKHQPSIYHLQILS